MPQYTFELRDGAGGTTDEVGVSLPDRGGALRYAHNVVHELMSHRELQTRFWRLDVYEDDHQRVFEIPFASVDQTIAHLSAEWRRAMERLCERRRSLAEVMHAAGVTVRESRALVARSRGKLYVAAEAGRSTIRD